MKQTTFKKDIKGNTINVGDTVAYGGGNGYFKEDGTLQRVFTLKTVRLLLNENNEVYFGLGNYYNIWKGEDCEVLSLKTIKELNIPKCKPFYFKNGKVIHVTDEEYFKNSITF